MSNNRLIINARGETAKVIEPSGALAARLQISALQDRTYPFLRQPFMMSELELAPLEMIALAAQLADRAGYAAEFRKVRNETAFKAAVRADSRDAPIKASAEQGAAMLRDILHGKIVPGKPATQNNVPPEHRPEEMGEER